MTERAHQQAKYFLESDGGRDGHIYVPIEAPNLCLLFKSNMFVSISVFEGQVAGTLLFSENKDYLQNSWSYFMKIRCFEDELNRRRTQRKTNITDDELN